MLNRLLALILICGLCSGAAAQEAQPADTGAPGLTREEMEDNLKLQEALIKLKEARETRDKYQRDYNMNLDFYKAGIVTLKELNESEQKLQNGKLAYERAKIQLEKTRLGFLTNATRIEILSAKKYLTEDGDRRASITLKNASNIEKAMAADPSLKQSEVGDLLRIKQLKVTLESGSIIGDPYERIVEELKVGAEVTVDFDLLKDVQALVIALDYGSTKEKKNVFLRKESLREIPMIETSQGSQQGELGSIIRYTIELERLAEDEKRFNLIKLGLPRHFTANFKQGNATISNVKFNQKISLVNVALEVVVPEKLDKELVDRTVEFYVVVTKPSQAKAMNELNMAVLDEKKEITTDDLDKLDCNYLRLDLTPTGKGELEIVVENRFKEIKIGESADFRIKVHNTGTLEIKNIDIDITPPFEWNVEADPGLISSLLPDAKETITIHAEHNKGAEIGEYDVRIQAVGEAGYEEIESEEKNFTVKLAPKAKLMQNLILVGVLIAVVVIISVVSVIVSRR